MSFSSVVKNELCRIENAEKCCVLSELAAVISISGIVKLSERNEANIRIVTENAAFARKIFSTIKKAYNVFPEVLIRKSKKLKKHTSYILIITLSKSAAAMLGDIEYKQENSDSAINEGMIFSNKWLPKKSCCKKAYLRGAFLSGGSVTDPEKTYHLEITTHSKVLAQNLNELINGFGLNAKIVGRKGNYVVYLKEGENIVDFLNIIGAHSALMELENVRILKEMRNNVNRIVNCETANLDKTVNASVRQIENIVYIKETIGFDKLPDNLVEIAELRLAYRDSNLKELGEMLNPILGKSGVNHRLRKLDQIADEIREMKGEI